MNAVDLITFINVSKEIINDKEKQLYRSILHWLSHYMSHYNLSDKECIALNTYFSRFNESESIYIYEIIKTFSEEKNKYKKIWVHDGDDYIIDPIQIPVQFFKSVIKKLNETV